MVDINRILCPVDYSEFSRHALAHALQLAEWYGATLTVLHVYPSPVAPPPVVFGGLPGPIPPPPPIPATTVSPEEVHQQMLEHLRAWIAPADAARVTLQFHARPGAAAANVLEEARAIESDLIVLGTHGHGGFDRLLLGSVTEKVLRKAACPVLTVPPRVADAPADAVTLFKRILCPTDFSDASLKALEFALSLAKEADAELILIHAIESLPDSTHWKMATTPAIVEYLRLYEHDALERLHRLIPDDARAWCRPTILLVTGKPHAEILRIARERDVHLIAMGVHGRNPIDRFFFGSTTNHVVRSATCPVVTLKV